MSFHRQRIEKLLTTWWLRALEDNQALEAVIRLLSREAKLLGLDEAKLRLEHSGELEVKPDLEDDRRGRGCNAGALRS